MCEFAKRLAGSLGNIELVCEQFRAAGLKTY